MDSWNISATGDFVQWLVAFRNPAEIWRLHRSYFLQEVVWLVLSFLTLCHALRSGSRYKWLWVTAVLHGLNTEFITYILPDIDNFWHAQGTVMFLGQRLPIYILLGLYPLFIYTASVATRWLRLPVWSQPFAVGLLECMMDMPYDILGIKLLWWSWHSTDPHISDRMYHVPWTSYFFHTSFGASFTILFYGVHKTLARCSNSSVFVEAATAIITALFTFPLGVIQFIILYHTLHDGYQIHSEICVFVLWAIYLAIVLCGLLSRSSQQERNNAEYPQRVLIGDRLWGLIPIVVIAHYMFYIYIVLTANPISIVSTGLHEMIGDCRKYVEVKSYSLLGEHIGSKRAHLCANDHTESYMSLSCQHHQGTGVPARGSYWYRICGTPWGNHMEYITIILTICVTMMVLYLKLMLTYTPPTETKPALITRKIKKIQ